MQISHPDQRGMTGFQMLLVVVIVLFVAYSVVRVAPMYLEYFNVYSSLNSVRDSHSGQSTSVRDLQLALLRQFRINHVNNPERMQIRVVPDGRDYLMSVEYETRTPWVGNLHLLVRFEHQVRVTGV